MNVCVENHGGEGEGNEKLNAMTVVEMNFYSRFKFSFVVF